MVEFRGCVMQSERPLAPNARDQGKSVALPTSCGPRLCRVDPVRNLMWIKGSLHGPQGGFVMVRDARRKRSDELDKLPFPTRIGDPGEPQQATPKRNEYDTFKP